MEVWDSVLASGYDEIVYIPMSSGLSGSCQSAAALLIIEGERLDAYAKVRGTKNCRKRLLEEMKKKADEFYKGGACLRAGAAGSFISKAEHQEWTDMAGEIFAGEKINYDPLTVSIACHVGHGAFGMGISRKL